MTAWPLVSGIGAPSRRMLLRLAFARADGLIASFPKSGRTWLRFILTNYLVRVFDLGVDVDFRTMFRIMPNDRFDRLRGWPARALHGPRGVPLIVLTHAPFEHRPVRERPVLVLCREPKDTLVSYFFHLTRHGGARGEWTIDAFMRDPRRGAEAFCRYYNGWAAGLAGRRSMVLAYERIKRDPESALRDVITFFGLPSDPHALQQALGASSFEAMRSVERRTSVPGQRYDPADEHGRRVRRGRVGGFAQHLSPEDIAYVEQTCQTMLTDAAKSWLGQGWQHGLKRRRAS